MNIEESRLISLIQQAKRGDLKAFERLYKAYHNYVCSIILDFFNGNGVEVDDLIQEIFVTVFQQLNTLKKEASFRSWVAGITLNMCRQYLRKKNLTKNKVTTVPIEDYEIEGDEQYEPEYSLESDDKKRAVMKAVKNLPSRQRLVMLLYYFEGYKIGEIASALDTTTSSVKGNLFKGRNNIKETLKKELGKEEDMKVLSHGLLMTFYGKELVSEHIPNTSLEPLWRNIKKEIQPEKSLAPLKTGIAILSLLLILIGTIISLPSAEKKPIQSKDISIGQPMETKLEQVHLPLIKESLPAIKNTAYVNGKETNTVSISLDSKDGNGVPSDWKNGLTGLPKTGGTWLLILAAILIGLGLIMNQQVIRVEKRSKLMNKNQKRKLLSMAIVAIMLASLIVTSLPMNSMALTENETLPKTEDEVTTPGDETLPTAEIPNDENQPFIENKEGNQSIPTENQTEVTENQAISPATVTESEGVTFDVSIAKSLDGSKPSSGYVDDETIDLANVTRYDMFYAWIKINYKNESGVPLENAKITMQLPKPGEPGYFQPQNPYAPPGWAINSNIPSPDDIGTFPKENFVFGGDRSVTWTAKENIGSSSGTVYIKIPMRDPYTDLGLANFTPKFSYSKNGIPGEIESKVTFDIKGEKDAMPYSITRIQDLGFVPSESDAEDYYYVKYKFVSSYTPGYVLPKPAFQQDQALAESPSVTVPMVMGGQLISIPKYASYSNNTLSMNALHSSYGTFVIRYPKANFQSEVSEVDVVSHVKCYYVGENPINQNIAGMDQTLTHPVGGSNIPLPSLGRINSTDYTYTYSEESLKNGSVPFSGGYKAINRSSDTIMGEELVYEISNVEFIKDNSSIPADYGINRILISYVSWTGNTLKDKPLELTVTAHYGDGSSKVLATRDEAYLLANPTVLSATYPNSDEIKRVTVSVKNVPAGFSFNAYITGYITGYPDSGADFIRTTVDASLYGYKADPTDQRPEAINSGIKTYDSPIIKDTPFNTNFSITPSTTDTINPGGTASLTLKSGYSSKAQQSYTNPEFDVLLPAGMDFISYTNSSLESEWAGYQVHDLPDGKLTTPRTEVITNFQGTGRTLVRIIYENGILQPSEIMSGNLKVKVASNIPVNTPLTVDAYFSASNPEFSDVSKLLTSSTSVVDNEGFDSHGTVNPKVYGKSMQITATRGADSNLYSVMKGSLDPDFTAKATTKQNTVVDGKLVLDHNGDALTGIQLVSILPYEGDGSSQWGTTLDNQQVKLKTAVDTTTLPAGTIVYYNLSGTNDPNASGWTTTFTPDAKAVRVQMPSDYVMQGGGNELLEVPLKLQVPGSTDVNQLLNMDGTGLLEIKAYAASGLSALGLVGDASTIQSMVLGIDATVFEDTNGNGIKDTDEMFAENKTVKIFKSTDDENTATPIYSDETDANGTIAFMDGVNGVSLGLQSYKVVVEQSDANYTFTTGVGDVTTNSDGLDEIEISSATPLAHVVAGYREKMMTIEGYYWKDGENPANGIKNPDTDRVIDTQGRIVKLYDITNNKYLTETGTVDDQGFYKIEKVPVGSEYRVEFPYDETREVVSPSVLTALIGENEITRSAEGIGSYSFDSTGMADGAVETVNGAIYENGTITVRFSTDGENTIGSSTLLNRQLPTAYEATIGDTKDITQTASGTFVVPDGYKLVDGEPTQKNTTINFDAKSSEIVFLIEALNPELSAVKTSSCQGAILAIGDEIEYNITVTNSGNGDATDVVIEDKVPEGTEFVSSTNGVVPDENGTIQITADTIAADGGTATLNFKVKVLKPEEEVGSWTIVNDQAKVDKVPTNSTTDEGKQSILKSEKTSDIPEGQSVKSGDIITYTITTTNVGDAASEKVAMLDTIPAGTSYVEGSLSVGTSYDGNKLTLEKDSLAPGETLTLSFKVKVNESLKTGDKIENIAQVNNQDTNKIETPVEEDVKAITTEKPNGILPKTGGYILIGLGLLLGLVGTGILMGLKRRGKITE